MSAVGNTFQNAISSLPYNLQQYVGGPSYPGMQTNQPQMPGSMGYQPQMPGSMGYQQPNVGGALGGGPGVADPNAMPPARPGLMKMPTPGEFQ